MLTNLLLFTGQLSALALFTTFFFVSDKLREATSRRLAQRTYSATSASVSVSTPTQTAVETEWQETIDQAALPILALSLAAAPFLGIQRATAILRATFGYDYCVWTPLSFLQAAAQEGIYHPLCAIH